MAKYLVQMHYVRYIEVNGESEKDAEIEARMKAEEELEDEPLKAREFTFTTTDKLEDEHE